MLKAMETTSWRDKQLALGICTWLVVIVYMRILFRVSKVSRVIPESALLILLGLGGGYILDFFFLWDIYLDPDLFFLYLLPPIALEAGYFMPSRVFFNNLGTILLYAIVGTMMNLTFTASCLWLFSGFYQYSILFKEILLFSTLISAVDPVAVLSVFEEIHVNRLLYTCVFGESLLNDAVVIVMYQSITELDESASITPMNGASALLSFSLVCAGGFAMGLLGMIITSWTTKWTHKQHLLQPLICILFPYLLYLTSEHFHVSGIIAIVVCGLLMKPYVSRNMNDKMNTTTKYFIKTLSNTCEALIFLFLGLSTFSKSHDFDVIFSVVTVFSCLIGRFLVVTFLTYFANRRRVIKIRFVDQLIIAYGGLRGAICYGLAQTMNLNSGMLKDMMITTTIVVIGFTVFLQGTTIRPLVSWLGVKRHVSQEESITHSAMYTTAEDIMGGIQSIIEKNSCCSLAYFKNKILWFNAEFVEPALMVNPPTSGGKLLDKYAKISARESRQALLGEFATI